MKLLLRGPGRKEFRAWQMLLALFLVYLASFAAVTFWGFGNYVTADMYSDTLLSKYMWEQKTLFPENWVFGNQFYVIATPVVSALFYGLTGSINLSMSLATAVQTAALLASIYWLFRSFLGRTESIAGLTAMVSAVVIVGLSATRREGEILFILASYYSCYLLTAVVVWGDYLRSLFLEKRLLCTSFFLGLLFSFATGMQSIRQTCVMTAPLLAFEGLRVLAALVRRQSPRWRNTLRAGCVAAANLAGVVFIHLLNIPAQSTYVDTSFSSPAEWPERFSYVIKALSQISGLHYIHSYGANYTPFLFAHAALCIIVVLAALCLSALRLRRGTADALDALNALNLLSLLAVGGSVVLLYIPARSIYFFMWYFLVCTSAVSLIRTDRALWKRTALVLLCAVSAANLWFSYARPVRYAFLPNVIGYRASYEELGAELKNQDTDILYGSSWAASLTCYFTDGAVTAVPWGEQIFQLSNCLYPRDLIQPKDNQRAVYMIFDSELEEAQRLAAEQGAELTPFREFKIGGYDDSAGALYTSTKQLMSPPETAP